MPICHLTGVTTGDPADPEDLTTLTNGDLKTPVLIGSGVTEDNLETYFNEAHGLIVGSHFKRQGFWSNELDELRVSNFLDKVKALRMNHKQ